MRQKLNLLLIGVFCTLLVSACGSVKPKEGSDAVVSNDAAPECELGETICKDDGNFYQCLLGEWALRRICTGECDNRDGCAGTDPPPTGGVELSYIWIPNTMEGTLSKIDTREEVEVARYITCPLFDGRCGPTHTSINLHGDAVVVNGSSYQSSVVKYAADVRNCVDRNNNGTIETSTGPTDVLPWGADECMVWNSTLPTVTDPLTNADLSVQGQAVAWDGQTDPVLGTGGSLWVGTCVPTTLDDFPNYIYKINGDTGEIITTVTSTDFTCAYGGAMDRLGNFWFMNWGDIASDNLIKLSTGDLSLDGRDVPCGEYGITVDPENRVWVGGGPNCAARYDPVDQTHTVVQFPPLSYAAYYNLAVGVEKSEGYVWQVHTYDSFVHKIDEESMELVATYSFPGAELFGISIDFEGYVWVISYVANEAYKFDPDTETFVTIPTGEGPQSYSDMTGVQLQSVAVD